MRKGKVGRPSKFTPLARERILEALAVGATYEIAAGYAGTSRQSLHRWITRGSQEEEGEYRAFFDAVKRAEQRAAVAALANISKAAQAGDWKCSAWLLERKFGYRRGGAAIETREEPPKQLEDDPRAFWLRQAQNLEKAMESASQAESWQAFAALQRQLLEVHGKIRAYDRQEIDPLDNMTDEGMVSEIVAAIVSLPPVLRQKIEGEIANIDDKIVHLDV